MKLSILESEIDYYSNDNILELSRNYKQAIIVIHGTNRNAEDYYDYVENLLLDDTLIIAPEFNTRAGDNSMFWSSGGWKQGHKSKDPSRTSSFEVIDQILTLLEDKVNRIKIIGHSAGGQFVQRYAVGTRHPFAYDVTYIVMNPSSYMYLTDQRPAFSGELDYTFEVPSTYCDYNEYKYGLDDLNSYMSRIEGTEIVDIYANRNVYYCLGMEDNHDNGNMDTSCSANLQGDNRWERGLNFFRCLAPAKPNHYLRAVLGVGHSPREMFASREVKDLLKSL